MTPILGMLAGAAKTAANVATGGLVNSIFSGGQDKRQLRQQQALTEMQGKEWRANAAYQKQLDLAMIKDSFGQEIKNLKDHNMSIGLMYGGGGAGGSTTGGGAPMTTGGQAATASQTMGDVMQLAMMKAQTENIEADTTLKQKAAGQAVASQTKTEEEAKQIAFQNRINSLVSEENFAKNISWANQKLQYESMKTMADYNAWEKSNFAGNPTDDENSPLAKAYKAGLEKSIEELKTAKANANTAKAESIIKNFTAELTKQGIAEGTPWYVKMATDLLNKAGININQEAANKIK